MKNRLIFTLLLLSGSLVITSGINDITSNAAPLGSTGAPGEYTCAKSGCHTGSSVNAGSALLDIDYGSSFLSYQPNTVYDLTVSLQQPGIQRFGFQLLALNANNQSAGAFIITDSARTQNQSGTGPYAGRNYVTYKYAGTEPFSAGLGQWSFKWQAPATHEGAITFYAAAVAANNDGTDAGDSVYINQVSIQPEATGSTVIGQEKPLLSIFPSPAHETLNVRYRIFEAAVTGLSLSDLRGQIIYTSVNRFDDAGEQMASMDVAQLPAGVYLLSITANNITQTEKVVITK